LNANNPDRVGSKESILIKYLNKKEKNDIKMGTKRKVIENSFLYIFSSFLFKAINFLLLPIYTFFLTPEDYGIINLFDAFIQVSIFIVTFSLYASAIRFYTEYKKDIEKLKNFYGTIVNFTFFSGLVFFTISIIFRELLVTLFFEGISFYPIVFVALFTLTFVSLHTMHQSILEGIQQGRKLTLINLVVFILTVMLKLFFIGYLQLGALGVLTAQLIINLIYFVFILIDLKRNNLYSFTIDFKILIEALKYSIPIMPHNLSTHIAIFASRIFIKNSATLASVGLYGVAMQFGSLIDLVQAAVNKAFQPWFFEIMSKMAIEDRKESVNFTNLLLLFYSLIYMGVGLFSQEAVILMTNEQYVLSWTVIPILVIGFSIKSIYYFYVNVIFFYKQAVKKLFIATISGSLLDIILAYLLVPLYGMYGAAVAFVCAKIIMVLIIIFMSKPYNDIGYQIDKMLIIIMPSLLFMGIGLYFSYTKYRMVFNWNNFMYKLVLLIAYICFIYFTNRKVIDQNIRSGKIQKILKEKKKKK